MEAGCLSQALRVDEHVFLMESVRDCDTFDRFRHGLGNIDSHPGAPSVRSMSLHDAQELVDAWISQFEEGYFPPLANLARLIEEVGELAREINHLYGSKPKRTEEPDADLALELGDVLFVLICLANERGIDLDAALHHVIGKYQSRDAARWTSKD